MLCGVAIVFKPDDKVLYHNQVWEVRYISGARVQIKMCGVDFHHATTVFYNELTPITNEVADCMLASDPPEVTERYATGWTDPRNVFK